MKIRTRKVTISKSIEQDWGRFSVLAASGVLQQDRGRFSVLAASGVLCAVSV